MLSGQRHCGHQSSRFATTRSRLALLAVGAVVAVLTLVPSVLAFQDYISANTHAGFVMGPGGYDEAQGGEGGGYNYRTQNTGCRLGNSGLLSVSYYNTSGNRVTYTGPLWTNCAEGLGAQIFNNGYFRSRCTHEGTVSWTPYCYTWNYSP
jgi:hypothetical protein